MNKVLKSILITASAALIVAPAFAGDARDAGPRREQAVRVQTHTERAGAIVRIPVALDLTGVSNGSGPAVLGAYVLRADFDPMQVRFVGIEGGTTAEFSGAPVFTNADLANRQGFAKAVAVQPSLHGPVGKVSVATLEFKELVDGGAGSIRVKVEGAAAAPTPDGRGEMPATLELPVQQAE